MKQLYFAGAHVPIAAANRHLAHGFFTYKGVVCPFSKVVYACCHKLK